MNQSAIKGDASSASTRANLHAEAAAVGCTLERVGRGYRVNPPSSLANDPFADDNYAEGTGQVRVMLRAYAQLLSSPSGANR